MIEEDSKNSQQEVEKALFTEFHKTLDRYYSLIHILSLSTGLIVTCLNITTNKDHENIRDVVNNYHIDICFLFILIAFLITIRVLVRTSHYRSLVKKGEVIQFREQDELINANVELYSTITKLKDLYIIAISLLVLSIGAFYNYFADNPILTILFPIGLVMDLALIIRESRKEI